VGQTVLDTGLGGASTHFAVIEKRVLSRTLRPKYAGNVLLFENKRKL